MQYTSQALIGVFKQGSFDHVGLSSASSGGHTLLATSLPFNPVTVDLPHSLTNSLGSEENGVLLCNLDELSK